MNITRDPKKLLWNLWRLQINNNTAKQKQLANSTYIFQLNSPCLYHCYNSTLCVKIACYKCFFFLYMILKLFTVTALKSEIHNSDNTFL